jgi:hypothetical protein
MNGVLALARRIVGRRSERKTGAQASRWALDHGVTADVRSTSEIGRGVPM